MATLQIRKKSLKTWLHIPSDADNFILSKFYCKTDANTFKIVEESGSNRREYSYTDITVYDDTAIGTAETFASSQALMLRLEALKYTGFNRDGDIPTPYIESVVAGTNVTIDNTDPLNPIISSTGGGGSMDLQDVTNNGNATTNSINVQLGNEYTIMNRDNLYSANDNTGSYAFLENTGTIAVNAGDFEGTIKATNLTSNNVNLEFPQKAFGSYTIATTDDLTPISQGIAKGTASGTDTYTTTITGVTSYADGDVYLIRFTNGNTTGCSLNINGLGAVNLYRNNDGALIGGDIIAGGEMLCVYNSTLNAFQCIGTAPNTLLAYVTNAEATTITKGQAVYVYGGTGDRITVKLANNTLDSTSAQTIGLVLSTSIGANQKGLIITQGQIDNLSLFPTSTWADGDFVYLGATAGSLTKVKPTAPNHLVYLGYVTTASNGSAGRMYVKVQNGYELDELHNVVINSGTLANDDVLAYDFATSLWKNKAITQGTPLVRQEFSYSGSQTFTLSNTPSAIYAVFVNGQELNSSQYSFVTTTLTIVDTLQSGYKVNIVYSETAGGVLDYYTKAQIDAFNYEEKHVNFIEVNDVSDLPASSGGVITLIAGYTYLVLKHIDLLGARIVCGADTVIVGWSSENCSITSTGLSASSALITSTYSLPIRNISFTHDLVFDLQGDGTTTALDWFGVNLLNCASGGTIKNYTNFVAGDSALLNSGGFSYDGTIGTVAFSNCLFDVAPTKTAITILPTCTISRRVRIIYSSFVVLSGETGVNFSTSATVNDERYILDTVNFSGGGTYTTGIDATSNKALFANCVGITNTSTRGFMHMLDNVTATAITGTASYFKAAGTTTASSANSKFTMPSSNRLTYTGAFTQSFFVTVNCNVRTSVSTQTINIVIAKNGTNISESEMTILCAAGSTPSFGGTQCVVELTANDYIELYVRNTSSVNNVIVSDFNMNITKIPV